MEMREKLAQRLEADATLETEGLEGRHHQPREPTSTIRSFPQPRLRGAIAALHRLLKTMHTTFGKPCLLGKVSNTLCSVLTKTIENPKAFVPKSHVGLFSEESLNSWWNSVFRVHDRHPTVPP